MYTVQDSPGHNIIYYVTMTTLLYHTYTETGYCEAGFHCLIIVVGDGDLGFERLWVVDGLMHLLKLDVQFFH